MGIKISALPAASGAVSAMQFEVNNAGVSQRLTLAQMFALSMAAVTVDTPLLNLAQTWNAGAVTFTGWKLNVTDTASAAGSKLLDLQVGGTSKFYVGKDGAIRVGDVIVYSTAGGQYCRFGPSRFAIPNELGLGPSGNPSSTDLYLTRDAANALAQRNGTTAQEFRLYNTYTDASNHERLAVSWSANVCRLWTANAGTGAARDLVLGAGGNEVLRLGPDTGAGVKLGFHGVTPIVRAQLSTGASHTVDDVITALQNLGLVSQS